MPPKVRGHVRKVKVEVQGHALNIGQPDESRSKFRGQCSLRHFFWDFFPEKNSTLTDAPDAPQGQRSRPKGQGGMAPPLQLKRGVFKRTTTFPLLRNPAIRVKVTVEPMSYYC